MKNKKRICRKEHECDVCGLMCRVMMFIYNAPYNYFKHDIMYLCQHCYSPLEDGYAKN